MAYVQLEDLYGAIEAVVFPKTLAQYEALIQPGQVILVTGRLDIQEEKEPKLLVERVESVPEQAPPMPADTNPAPNPRAGLYLRLPSQSGKEFESAYNAVTTAPGTLPVYIRFVDSGKMVKAPKEWCVTPNEGLLTQLKEVLGESNVAMVE